MNQIKETSADRVIRHFDQFLASVIESVPEVRLEFLVGELTNKFGTDAVKKALDKDIEERRILTEDKVRADCESDLVKN